MYIKSIVLDGFKSYGSRVEITGFDPEFNAITGLNGTGKSNILDSICFVLGITNLSNVRAGSLQELIYKHGQAGITKATVSITFDNRDKNQCPIGYENHDEITVTRQVVMGGKNKYLINGINVQNKRVSDLFCSVQLNVNNPHFLIMQGRITKVLNMKPPEILSMVEEAAGTRMYETKKQAAQKTIEKKDAKLRELNDIIKEDIAPKLQKLQDERAQFQEYQKIVRELENLSRLHVAWRYVTAEKNAKEAEAKVTEVKDEIKSKKEEVKSNEKEVKDLDRQIADLNKKLDEESGSVLKELETEAQSLEKTEAVAASSLKAAKEALAAHEKRARLLRRALADDEHALAGKRDEVDKVSSTFESLRSASEAGERALAEAQERFLAVSSGLEQGSESLQDQLMAAKQEVSECSTAMSQCDMERKHAEQRLRAAEKEFGAASAQYAADQGTLRTHEEQLDRLKMELTKMNFEEDRFREVRERSQALQTSVRQTRDAADRLAARLQRCDFHYQLPEPNFDRKRVAGPLCRLIDVPDPIHCTAIETVAGGRLFNVVVDTEVTSKLLLERGGLQTRTVIVPLNKIVGHIIDAKTQRLAQEIGGGPENVQLALDLVSFEQRHKPAMVWAFGGTFVCRDLATAKRVTFHPRVRRRCVTLDGDVFDPSGTLSGGARQKGGSILLQLQDLKQLERELQAQEAELAQCSADLTAMQQVAENFASTKQRYEMMYRELEEMKARMSSTSHAQLHTEVESLRAQLQQSATVLGQLRDRHQRAAAKVKELEAKVKDIKGHREREFKKAEEGLKKAKKEAEERSKAWKEREQQFETLRLELQELEKAVQNSRTQLDDASDSAATLQDTLQQATGEHAKAMEAVKEIQSRIKGQRAEIASRSGDIGRLSRDKERLLAASNDLELQAKELEYKVKELQTEAVDCEKRIKSLESENPWIQSEREYFGCAGGLYDFGARHADLAGKRLAQLQERKDKLARGLNTRAHMLLGKEEEQYQDVLKKKKIVEADRAKLVSVISDLDEMKKRTLAEACEQVNRDFGSIFSSLLPGAQAQLRPPQGLSVLDGLEVRVGFNNTWKESLGELSGGQRSLVALSLVLALLVLKPAPLYILDEVDAALDLSHTQNIGLMLRQHFRHSQFIIVSLKDGMFNNANVLFRTRFVDGMSSVQRTTNPRPR